MRVLLEFGNMYLQMPIAKFYGIVGTISWYIITPSHLRSTISQQFSMGRQKKNRTF